MICEKKKKFNMKHFIVPIGEDFSVFCLIFFWYFVIGYDT